MTWRMSAGFAVQAAVCDLRCQDGADRFGEGE